MADDVELEAPVALFEPLRDPIGTLRRRWRWMSLALALGLSATAAFVMARTARYSATATVLVTTQQIREDLVPTVVLDDPIQRIDALLGGLLARDRLAGLIEKHQPYPALVDVFTLNEIIERVRGDITISPTGTIGPRKTRGKESARLFTIAFESDDPNMAADFANELAAALTEDSIRSRTTQANLATGFLRRELERSDEALRQKTREIREFKERYRGELPGDLVSNLARLERRQAQRQSLALQIAEANTQVAMLAAPGAIAGTSDSPEARLAALRVQLESHRGIHTDRHPDVRALEQRIAAVEAEVAASGGSDVRPGSIGAVQQTVVELRAQLRETERELAALDEKVARIPARQEELAALEEPEAVLRENYRSFLKKVQDAELAAKLESAQQGARISSIDRAVPPSAPTSSRLRYALAGLVASLGLAGLIGFVLERLDPVLSSAAQVESFSGLPVLGSAPHIS